jgi:glycerol kinase
MVGQCCFAPGTAKNTYGTGSFLLLNTGGVPVPSEHGLITTVAYRLGEEPPVYALEGSVAVAGALVQWLRDNLGLIGSAAEVEELAASVPDTGDVYVVPAFSGLFAPYWRPDARGTIVGLTRYTTRAHLARACLEATAFQTVEVLEAMVADSGSTAGRLTVDGGMTANDLLLQLQADLLGIPVVRPRNIETTAYGAATAAGLATGVWESTAELEELWAVDRQWDPTPDADRERRLTRWRQAVTRSLDWATDR